jgi:hypothetical protein
MSAELTRVFPDGRLRLEPDLAVFIVSQSGIVMLNSSHSRRRRQQLVEMTMPPRWIVATSKRPRCGPIEDRLNATPDATRRFRLGFLNRLEDLQDVGGVDCIDSERPDDRMRVRIERSRPLFSVLYVFQPARRDST